MNSIDFCYWLQGFFEIGAPEGLSEAQFKVVENHLNLVFKHEIDPLRESQTAAPAWMLDEAHSPLPSYVPHSKSNDPLVRC